MLKSCGSYVGRVNINKVLLKAYSINVEVLSLNSNVLLKIVEGVKVLLKPQSNIEVMLENCPFMVKYS